MITKRRTRVLAINFGGIGDEVLFLPALEAVRRVLPDCDLTLLLEPRSRSVEQITKLIDHTVTFDIKKKPLYLADLLQLLGTLRSGAYDLVISSGGSKPVSILLFLSGIAARIGYDSGPLSRKILTAAVPLNKDQYAAVMYHDLSKGLQELKTLPDALRIDSDNGARPSSNRATAMAEHLIPRVNVPNESLESMRDWLRTATASSAGSRRVLIHPGMSRMALEKGIIKTWSPQNWASLVKLLAEQTDVEILLCGGPDDEQTLTDILRQTGTLPKLRNCYGITKNLADLAALIALSDVLVCVDSAPMHIGVGLRKHLVALFGPTDAGKLLPEDSRFIALSDVRDRSQANPGSFAHATSSQPASARTSLPKAGGNSRAASMANSSSSSLIANNENSPISQTASGNRNATDSLPSHYELGVQLQPDIVFQSVLDQLKVKKDLESYQAQDR